MFVYKLSSCGLESHSFCGILMCIVKPLDLYKLSVFSHIAYLKHKYKNLKFFCLVKSNCADEYIVGNNAKRQISKRVFQKSKARQNFRKTNISYLLIRARACTYQGVRNVCFSEILACFAFLKHSFWDSPFWLITDDIFLFSFFLSFFSRDMLFWLVLECI